MFSFYLCSNVQFELEFCAALGDSIICVHNISVLDCLFCLLPCPSYFLEDAMKIWTSAVTKQSVEKRSAATPLFLTLAAQPQHSGCFYLNYFSCDSLGLLLLLLFCICSCWTKSLLAGHLNKLLQISSYPLFSSY